MSEKTLKRWPALEEAKRQLEQSLARPDAPPFLGYHELPIGEEAKKELRLIIDGYDDRIADAMKIAPLVTAWAIAHDLRLHYGDEGDRGCYPIIAATLGLGENLFQQERKYLIVQFRRCCAWNGLPIPPKSYSNVDVFLCQAGVSLAQVDAQVKIFKQARAELGDPPVHSTTALAAWQQEAVNDFAPVQRPRLRKVLLHDATGFHAGLFARIVEGGAAVGEVETAIAAAVSAMPDPSSSGGARPAVQYSDGDLVVIDTRGRRAIEVRDDGRWRPLATGRQYRLNTPWPDVVQWRETNAPARENALRVFSRSTRFLVCGGSSGRVIREVERTEFESVAIAAGEIVILSRESFSVDGVAAGQLSDGTFLRFVDLSRTVTLNFVDGAVELQPSERPVARIVGTRWLSRYGEYRWIERAEYLECRYSNTDGAEAKGFNAILHHPALGPSGVTVALGPVAGETGLWRVDLADVLPQSGVFGLLRMELRRAGDTRVYLRDAVWLWPGLRQLRGDGVFDAPTAPPNLDPDRCDHLRPTPEGVTLDDPSLGGYRAARIVFTGADARSVSESGLLIFELSPPGISLTMLDSTSVETPLAIGQRLALGSDEPRRVMVRTPWPTAQLDIGGRIERHAFSDIGSRMLSAAELCATSDHRELRYRQDPRAAWKTLLTFVELEVPQRFEMLETEDDSGFEAQFGRAIAAVRINSYGVLQNTRRTVQLEQPPALLILSTDGTRVQVRIRHNTLAANDITLLTPEVRFEGDAPDRWRTISNSRHDTYRWVTVGRQGGVEDIVDRIRDEGPAFLRVAEVLDQSVPQECWSTFERTLVRAWERLGVRLSRTEAGGRTLLDAATRVWPQEYTPTWVPILHPLRFAPRLFGQEPEAFRFIKGRKNRADGMELLGEVSVLSGVSASEFLSSEAVRVDPLIGFGFTAAGKGGANIGHLDLVRLRLAKARVVGYEPPGLWNPRAPMLTPAHHSWCITRRFLERLRVALDNDQNSRRFGQLVAVAAAARGAVAMIAYEQVCFDVDDSENLGAVLPNLVFLVSLVAKDSQVRSGNPRELIERIHRELLRRSPDNARPVPIVNVNQVTDSISFLLRLAPELLAFYLLLWKLSAKGEGHA